MSKRLLFNGRDVKGVEPVKVGKDSLQALLATRRYLEHELLAAQRTGSLRKADAIRVKLQQLSDASSADDASKAMQEEEDFTRWLLGRGNEADHIRTPWFRTPLTNTVEGAREYVEVKMEARQRFIQEVAALRVKRVPRDITEAYRYWKYIVKGMDDASLMYMEDWSGIVDHEADRLKYGRQVAEKLDGWWQKRMPILPTDEVQLMETDFDAYMRFFYALDPDKRQRLAEGLNLRAETLEALAMNQHYPSIMRLLLEYQDRAVELDDALVYNLNAFERLQAEEDRLKGVLVAIARSTGYGNNEAVRSAFAERITDVRQRQAAVLEALRSMWKKAAEEPEGVKKLMERLNKRAERAKVPKEIWDVILGDERAAAETLELQNRADLLEKVLKEAEELVLAVNRTAYLPRDRAAELSEELYRLRDGLMDALDQKQ